MESSQVVEPIPVEQTKPESPTKKEQSDKKPKSKDTKQVIHKSQIQINFVSERKEKGRKTKLILWWRRTKKKKQNDRGCYETYEVGRVTR